MKMKLLLSVLVLSVSTISYADRMAGATRGQFEQACKVDIDAHCKGIFGPRNRIDCLKKNEEKISAACKAILPQRN